MIPEIVAVIDSARTGDETEISLPTHCPSCGTLLQKDEGKVAIFCPNKLGCPAQTSGSFKAFASKHASNIDGLGDKIIDLFIEKGFLTDFASIYQLHRYKTEILSMEGFELKKTENILSAIEATRNMDLHRFLLALCIPEVGRKTAKILAGYLAKKREGNEVLELFTSLTIDELLTIRDIGPVGAAEIVEFMEENRELLVRLLAEIHPKFPSVPKSS